MANALKTLFTDIASAIREKTGEEGTMKPIDFPTKISEITGGGGSSDLVKYVTFMSEDGTTELFKMPVLSGDDCKDPISHGDISKPTKASTNTQNFAYSGWSLVSGGSADSNILKNITEDKIVYTSFTASVRYYTVNFYDGSTLVDTMQVTYGGTANTDYIKNGYILVEWNPSNENITQDTNCYGVWEEGLRFSNASWEKIAELSANGTASQVFSVGDERIIDINGTPVTFMIAGFNHDYNNGSPVGITIITKNVPQLQAPLPRALWKNKTTLLDDAFMSYLPSDLQRCIKPVLKMCEAGDSSGISATEVEFKIFPLSYTEMNMTITMSTNYYNVLGEPYAVFGTPSQYRTQYLAPNNTEKVRVILRGNQRAGTSTNTICITTSGNLSTVSSAGNYNYIFGFCI